MPSSPNSKELPQEPTKIAATKRAKDNENDATSAKKHGRKGSEAIANNSKRNMQRHVQRKSRVKPLTKSSGSRGNAQTRRRKQAGD